MGHFKGKSDLDFEPCLGLPVLRCPNKPELIVSNQCSLTSLLRSNQKLSFIEKVIGVSGNKTKGL